MKRYFFIILTLLPLFLVCKIYCDELDIQMKRHYWKNAGFSIELPVDWNIQFLKTDYFTIKAVEPEKKKQVIVSYAYFESNNDNLETRFIGYIENAKKFPGDCKIIEKGNLNFHKYQSKWVILNQKVDGTDINSINYIIIIGNKEYFIGGFSFSGRFDQNQPIFNKIVKSFRLE